MNVIILLFLRSGEYYRAALIHRLIYHFVASRKTKKTFSIKALTLLLRTNDLVVENQSWKNGIYENLRQNLQVLLGAVVYRFVIRGIKIHK